MIVLYDFNCQVGEYLLNRVPEMCTKTKLFIDRWHCKGHKCASIFGLQAYPAYQVISAINSKKVFYINYIFFKATYINCLRVSEPFSTKL